MKRIMIYLTLFLFIFNLTGFIPVASAETLVGGELVSSYTVWTKSQSPYVLTRTVVIPTHVTLTIEPGVEVRMQLSGSTMFELKGKLVAKGTPAEPIILDGISETRIISARGSDSRAFAEIEYCEIRNIADLWNDGFGSFSLSYSKIENSTKHSNIINPSTDVIIEYNTFINSAGFKFTLGGETKVYIRNNNFKSKNETANIIDKYFIANAGKFETSELIVLNNTFPEDVGIILGLETGVANADMTAINNYWGTEDAEIISELVRDKNDTAAITNEIEFEPVLSAPHPDTPGAPLAIPSVNDVVSPTMEATQVLSGEKGENTAILVNTEVVVALNASTTWEYEIPLELGENPFEIKAKNAAGTESEIVEVVITRESEEVGACEEINYSEWGECLGGMQARTVLSTAPAGCDSAAAVLSQSCTAPTEPVVPSEPGFLENEKELVKNVDNNLSKRLSGRILLQVEENGEAWYVYPDDLKKYYLGRPADAFRVMRELGLGATHEFITSRTIYPAHVLGKILIDVDDAGKAYYINPLDKKAYYLGRPADAFRVMRELGLGVTTENLRKIEVGG